MSRLFSVIVTITLSVAACGATYAQPSEGHKYSQSEIKQKIHDAHTPQEYHEIATYFEDRQQYFEQQAQSEKLEWERRSRYVTGPAAKYPRPVDSSRNRYEYFAYEAEQMALQAEHFKGLSARSQ